MKKSDIVVSIFILRQENPPKERQVLRQLSAILKQRSVTLADWDQSVDPSLATEVITKVGSTKGELSMDQIIDDVDIVIKRNS